MKNMDYFSAKRHFDKYGFTTDFSFPVPDFIRYPPGAKTPIGLVNTSRLKGKLSTDNAALNPMLESFVEMYQQMASGLLNMSNDKLIPPGHPMYSKDNSITLLKDENKKMCSKKI